MHFSSTWFALVLAGAWSTGDAGAATPPNLIRNGGFDEHRDDAAPGWTPRTWGGEARYRIDPTGGRDGGPCALVESDAGGDACWSYEVEVEPSTDYRLSAWIRTDAVDKASGLGALVNLHQLQMVGKTEAVTGTAGWTHVTSEFNSGGHRVLWVNLLLGGWGRSTGRAWFDDVELVDITPPPPDLDESQKVAFFEERVAPILREHCFECHVDHDPLKGGLFLGSRQGLLVGGDAGPAVKLDDPLGSRLLSAVRYEVLNMPPSGKLPAEAIDTLTTWVRLGAPWTPEDADFLPESKRSQKKGMVIDDAARAHWSYQPIQRPDVPAVADSTLVATPVDAFLLSRLDEVGVPPAPPASRLELLRRVTYDLTGLPPTREEIESFLADASPGAYERVVDRLLASPHYGEKWARHWLDLVRYAETNSFERDGAKPHVWRYRDYVIRSFNEDKPFDRFALEQLAGDELDAPTRESRIATGFYRLGQWDDEPADPEQALFDELDDILTTTSQAFLGTTINCARCHDHKLDPIPQTDYYRMLAWFRNVRSYGVRSYESVEDASVAVIATGDQQSRYDDALRRHQEDVARVEARLKEIEALVEPDFSPVEREEFQHEAARVSLVEKRRDGAIDGVVVDEYAALTKRRDELRRTRLPAIDKALVVKERGAAVEPTHLLVRGNPHVLGDAVEPGLPEVLGQSAPPVVAPESGESSGRRLALAEWIVSPENPLSARVLVNRIWQHHFGRGIVATPNDFGFQGARPTHPDLLDWLASELIDGGWRLKSLHRTILLSNAYRMSSRALDVARRLDPDNAGWSRFDMRRLTAEEVRDSILRITGGLNLAQYGPSVFPEIAKEVLAGQSRPGEGWHTSDADDAARRSVYIHVKRSLIYPLLARFDYADTDFTCPERFATTQPTQSLTMLNSEFLNEQARALADDLIAQSGIDVRELVSEALWRVTQRPPRPAEVDRGVAMIDALQREDGATRYLALRCFCLMALNLNEMFYLD